MTTPSLGMQEIYRYGRQILLPEVGIEGQQRVKDARVLIVGLGGLGSPVALHLAAAGVGAIGMVESDSVDESNLHRQILYETADIGRSKVAAASEKLWALNPFIKIIAHETTLQSENALSIMAGYDIIVDATDNFPARYLINDCCAILKKPEVFGAVHRFEGQVSVFAPGTACYRCFFSSPPAPNQVRNCAEEGILGIMTGIVGSVQAAEVIKLILGNADVLTGRLLLVDGWKMRFREIALKKLPSCPVCGDNPTITKPVDYELFCGTRKKSNNTVLAISARQLAVMLEKEDMDQIVEVCQPGETTLDGFIPRSFLSLDEILVRRDAFDPDKPLLLVCKFGTRSEAAARLLADNGYNGTLYTLSDGILGWLRNSLAPERTSQ